jgi:hypothetical protein
MIGGDLPSAERARRWDQLADMYLAQQLWHYPPDYIRFNPTPERMLETVEKFEEDVTDHCRVHRPMSVTVRVGEAIPVSPRRVRGASEDPVMSQLNCQLHELLGLTSPAGDPTSAMGDPASAMGDPTFARGDPTFARGDPTFARGDPVRGGEAGGDRDGDVSPAPAESVVEN